MDSGCTVSEVYQQCLHLTNAFSHQRSPFLLETTTQTPMFQEFLLVLPFLGRKGELEKNYLGKFRSKVALS